MLDLRRTSAPGMMQATQTILGIESSCDDTAAAIVRRTADGGVTVLAERVAGQNDIHAPFGGVVPEIAARAHVEKVDQLIRSTMEAAELGWADLDGIAATSGPGLIGGVMVGLMTGKAIAQVHDLPFVAVNHLVGHALSPRLSGNVAFPYLLLLVSGGHCQLLAVHGLDEFERLGSTIDDAAGEAFDKTAKLLGLGFPGGPAVEKEADKGDPKSVDLPRPLLNRSDTLDMSFAGLKTAVRRASETEALSAQRRADICASFQEAVADILSHRAKQAMTLFKKKVAGSDLRFVVAGGVAANQTLRNRLEMQASLEAYSFHCPPMKWCTDNGAMIALVGAEKLAKGQRDKLDAPARARWPLDISAAVSDPIYGGGQKGVKA